MAHSQFLAFDLGAESGRALLGKLNGGRLTLQERHRFSNPNGRMNGYLQWNLLGQWEHLKEGLRKSDGESLDGIGIDTWGVDFGLLGPAGEVLGNPVHYRDARTDGIPEQLFARVPRQSIFQRTGTQIMQINSLFQLAAMNQSSPGLLELAETLLFVPDLFNYLFTGVRKSEFSIASTSQMFNMQTGRWATDLLKDLGLPARLLADVVPSGTVLGNLRDDVAAECGVKPMPVITPASHDTASAVAAVPSGTGTWCYISSGTWSLMGVELAQPIVNDKTFKYNYTNEGGVGGSIRLLKNIMGMWLVQECRRHWIREGHDHSYAELTSMAERAESTALINPDHKPFLSPGEMPIKIDAYCRQTGQRPPGTRGEFIRVCLESLALAYRRTLDGLEDLLGHRIDTIHIVGGGCQNELLNQMTANACGRRVIAGPVEATAIGNILVQAIAVGAISSLESARQVVRDSFEVKAFEPRDLGKWASVYSRFQDIIAK